MRVPTAAAALAAFLLPGCTSVDPSTADTAAVVGSPESQAAFAGLWRGTLDAVDDRLDGPIEFRLEKGAVLFHSAAQTPRRILWMRVSDGKLAGATDKWLDPVRRVDVYMTFEAEIRDGVLHGIVREKIGTEWADAATFTATRIAD